MNTTLLEVSSDMETKLNKLGIHFETNVNLSEFSYLKTGGSSKLVIFPTSPGELGELIATCSDLDVRYKVVGYTSNLLFLDNVAYSYLISTVRMKKVSCDLEEGIISAESGAMMPDLSRVALNYSVKGFEGLEGIPGTIGGGIFMNAGAYGCEIKDKLLEIDVVTEDGSFRTYKLSEIELGHRTSIFRNERKSEVICCCRFKAERGDAKKIFSAMELYHAKRHRYQDFCYPNLGSLFSGSPYRVFSSQDQTFRVVSAIYYFFCYKFKILRRESPINRRWLNDIAVKRFGLNYPIQPFSDKTINCLVNRGQGTEEMVRFIDEMKLKTKGMIPIENEVVDQF
jgi:UDP-N-acetylmuramate dehydrogenase